MSLIGKRVSLRKATEGDRRNVYEWLAHSDLTPAMMGPPRYPEHRPPTWEEFCQDYRPHYFDDSQPREGRCFIIVVEGVDVGTICHDALRADSVNLDIWLRSEADCGQGIGPEAMQVLMDHLHHQFGITTFIVSPSARNQRAIVAYRKAGFQLVAKGVYPQFLPPEKMEYADNVVLVKHCAGQPAAAAAGHPRGRPASAVGRTNPNRP